MSNYDIFDATIEGELEIVKYFIETQNIDINIRDPQNVTE